MNKQPTLTLIESLFSQTRDYVDTRIELVKLKMIDKASKGASSVISGLAIFLILFVCLVFLNIGVALLIGDLVGKAYIGFLAVAGIYAIAGLVVFKRRNKIFKAPVAGVIIRKFL